MSESGRYEAKPAGGLGGLVRTFREQRGWTQRQLAERWGFSREYVSLIERGKRRLYGEESVLRLAEILDIPLESLAAIGRYVPPASSFLLEGDGAERALLQALLEPARTTVKLSWLVWRANGDRSVVRDLMDMVKRLESALGGGRGMLRTAALEMLAYAHEMLGKVAFDKLAYLDARSHFREMYDLGVELDDADIVALALIHRADLVRRQGRYEAALRWLSAAEPAARCGRLPTAGWRWQTLARAHAEFQDKPAFLEAIGKAHECAAALSPAPEGSSKGFTVLEVLHERAHGHTLLGEPEKALEIYAESERLVAFRPLRDRGNFIILRAQALVYGGYVEEGVDLALEGLRLAQRYESRRHATRLRRMCDRVSRTPVARHPRTADLREALQAQGL